MNHAEYQNLNLLTKCVSVCCEGYPNIETENKPTLTVLCETKWEYTSYADIRWKLKAKMDDVMQL